MLLARLSKAILRLRLSSLSSVEGALREGGGEEEGEEGGRGLIFVVLFREEVEPFRTLGFVTGPLDAQNVLRLFLGEEVSIGSDFVRCRERFVFATARFTQSHA